MRHAAIALAVLLVACPRQRPAPPHPAPPITAPLPEQVPHARSLAQELVAQAHHDLWLGDPRDLVFDPLTLLPDGRWTAELYQELGGDRLFCAEAGSWAMIEGAAHELAAVELRLLQSSCPGRAPDTVDLLGVEGDTTAGPTLRFR